MHKELNHEPCYIVWSVKENHLHFIVEGWNLVGGLGLSKVYRTAKKLSKIQTQNLARLATPFFVIFLYKGDFPSIKLSSSGSWISEYRTDFWRKLTIKGKSWKCPTGWKFSDISFGFLHPNVTVFTTFFIQDQLVSSLWHNTLSKKKALTEVHQNKMRHFGRFVNK